ncbi:hypothetical protein ADUPG1_010545 [Aduncisulcus paluster]|uniref:Uncharacterized protein n=1 Tax=Aduncisulcus paluster TaxID=2918883 RepID=A0ABQ5JWD5_9EUKA|nr:hypothetical protein ADUPG1_010545 [Aduncisulcus paluster]
MTDFEEVLTKLEEDIDKVVENLSKIFEKYPSIDDLISSKETQLDKAQGLSAMAFTATVAEFLRIRASGGNIRDHPSVIISLQRIQRIMNEIMEYRPKE